jgi:hypothetical protein
VTVKFSKLFDARNGLNLHNFIIYRGFYYSNPKIEVSQCSTHQNLIEASYCFGRIYGSLIKLQRTTKHNHTAKKRKTILH